MPDTSDQTPRAAAAMSNLFPAGPDEAISVGKIGDTLATVRISGNDRVENSVVDQHDGHTLKDECEELKGSMKAAVAFKQCRPVQVGESLPDTLELREDQVKGEGLFARRAISVLEPVFALPYSIFTAIETEKLTTTCYSCLAVTSSHIPHIKGTAQENITLKKCAGCSQVTFCNKECQAKAWKAYHKLECRIFSFYRDNFPPMMIRAVIRIVLLRDKGLLPQKYWTAVMDLVSHENIWMDAPENNIIAMVRDIHFVTKSRMSMDTLTRLFWIMRTNSIELPTAVHGGIGTMLDPAFSKLNHSCAANVMLYRPWHTSKSGWNLDSNTNLTPEQRSTFATVVPLRDIGKGEELTIFYSDPATTVRERNKKHMHNHFFECKCSRCQDDVKAATEIEDKLPIVSAEYVAWSERILQQLEALELGQKGGYVALEHVSKAWDDRIGRYLKYPALYTASHFDQISLHQAISGLQVGAFDKTLINLLRSFFLIYPSRITGRHSYSNVHIMFVLLETFDMLLGINCSDKTVEKPKQTDVNRSLQALTDRGLGKETLTHWRQRICVHLRKCLEASAMRDLLPMVTKTQERMPLQGSNTLGTHSVAEDAMREALQLSEGRWKVVLEETGS